VAKELVEDVVQDCQDVDALFDSPEHIEEVLDREQVKLNKKSVHDGPEDEFLGEVVLAEFDVF
jgi:hypothetical protein